MRIPPWLVALACGVVPAAAAHVAWRLSVAEGHIPDCVPYWDGCTSISKAARHGTANAVFKLVMLPMAAVQAWHWWLAAGFLDRHGLPSRGLRPLGIVAGVALAVYVGFLGSEGAAYGWLRRYGITFYFASTFLAMLVYLRPRAAAGIALARAQAGTCLLMLALGLGNTLAQLVVDDRRQLDRLRDALEWQLGALLCAWFILNALRWVKSGNTDEHG